jgi:hypothetical protein
MVKIVRNDLSPGECLGNKSLTRRPESFIIYLCKYFVDKLRSGGQNFPYLVDGTLKKRR